MSVPVPLAELAELAEKIESFGPACYLTTVSDSAAPHVVSVAPAWSADTTELDVPAGKTSVANASARPVVTLLWPAAPGGDYCLLVDGTATAADGSLTVRPTRAVLHRMAAADADLPNCVTVLDRS